MKAMIMAAGLGTRLGELTRAKPKALITVGGRAMLDIVVENLARVGVSELMINLHFRGDLIREHVAKQNSYGMRVEFSEEPEILGTGGGLKNVEHFFASEQVFIVHNCDVYSDVNLQNVLDAQRLSGAAGALVVLSQKQSSYLIFDRENKLIGWEMADGSSEDFARRDPEEKKFCYTGIQLLTPVIFDHMRDEQGNFSIVRTYVKAARAGLVFEAFELTNNYWVDMGTPEKLKELETRLKQ